jgi:hypothetical protein
MMTKYLACIHHWRNAYKILKERAYFRDPRPDRIIILKSTLQVNKIDIRVKVNMIILIKYLISRHQYLSEEPKYIAYVEIPLGK